MLLNDHEARVRVKVVVVVVGGGIQYKICIISGSLLLGVLTLTEVVFLCGMYQAHSFNDLVHSPQVLKVTDTSAS